MAYRYKVTKACFFGNVYRDPADPTKNIVTVEEPFAKGKRPSYLEPLFEVSEVESEEESEVDADLLELLDNSIPDIVADLPALSIEELEKLRAAEQAGKTRTGLMKAIAEELEQRAKAEPQQESTSDAEVI